MWRGWEFSKATYLSMTTAGVWDAIAGKDGGARFFLRYQRVVEKRRNHVLEQGVEKGMELHRMDSRSRRVRERGRERDRQREAVGREREGGQAAAVWTVPSHVMCLAGDLLHPGWHEIQRHYGQLGLHPGQFGQLAAAQPCSSISAPRTGQLTLLATG